MAPDSWLKLRWHVNHIILMKTLLEHLYNVRVRNKVSYITYLLIPPTCDDDTNNES